MPAPLHPLNTRPRIAPRRFWTGMAIVLGVAGLGVWLDISATWPKPGSAACNWHGGGFAGYFNQLHCSSALLAGGAIDVGLFVYLWGLPVVLAGWYLWARRLRRAEPMR